MLNEGNPTNRATRAPEPTPTNATACDDDTTGTCDHQTISPVRVGAMNRSRWASSP